MNEAIDIKYSKMDIAYAGVFLKESLKIGEELNFSCSENILRSMVDDHGPGLADRCEKVMRGIIEGKIIVESMKSLVDKEVFFFLKVWKKDWDRRKGNRSG